jgi:iron complex transport system substrate-binding protein
MKVGALLAGLLLGACSPVPTGTHGGIVSTNPCADAILLRLVAPARVAAISHYSQDPAATSLPLAQVRRLRATAGTAEEVIALAPSLVLADSFAPPATLAAYARAGLTVVVLDSPISVAVSIAQVRQIAAAVGERGRGERMVRDINAALGVPPPPGPRPAALFFISGDLATGTGNLLHDLLASAGFRNAAVDYGLTYSGTVPLETLVTQPPEVVISAGDGRTAGLRRRLLPKVPQADFPRQLVNCGGPNIPAALERLRAVRAAL